MTLFFSSHGFADPMKPGAAIIVKSCGTKISANVTDGALSHEIDPLFFVDLNLKGHQNGIRQHFCWIPVRITPHFGTAEIVN